MIDSSISKYIDLLQFYYPLLTACRIFFNLLTIVINLKGYNIYNVYNIEAK